MGGGGCGRWCRCRLRDGDDGVALDEGMAKTEDPSQQSDSREVNERCGRLGLRLGLSILRCQNSNSGPIGGEYG